MSGARSLVAAPIGAFALAPVAVFFRTGLFVYALFTAVWFFRFTVAAVPAVSSRARTWASVLRVLAALGVAMVALSYDGYRAVLVATAGALLAYLPELAPAFGVPVDKRLRTAAWCALALGGLLSLDIALRRSVSWATWGTLPGHVLSGLSVAIGLLAWFELDRLVNAGAVIEPEEWGTSFRAMALRASALVFPFFLGKAIVAASALAGFWIAFDYWDLEPAALRAGILLVMVCLNGAFLLWLRTRSRQALRRGVGGGLFVQIPVAWWLVFPTQFDATAWKRSPSGSELRSDMAEDLIYTRQLRNKTRSEIRELLGPPDTYLRPIAGTDYYTLPHGPCSGFVIEYNGDTAGSARFWRCD